MQNLDKFPNRCSLVDVCQIHYFCFIFQIIIKLYNVSLPFGLYVGGLCDHVTCYGDLRAASLAQSASLCNIQQRLIFFVNLADT